MDNAKFQTFPPTRRMLDLMLAIHSHQQEHGIVPSFDEMRESVGLASKSGIHRMLGSLEERGLLARRKGRARCIVLTPAGKALAERHGLPVVVVEQ